MKSVKINKDTHFVKVFEPSKTNKYMNVRFGTGQNDIVKLQVGVLEMKEGFYEQEDGTRIILIEDSAQVQFMKMRNGDLIIFRMPCDMSESSKLIYKDVFNILSHYGGLAVIGSKTNNNQSYILFRRET